MSNWIYIVVHIHVQEGTSPLMYAIRKCDLEMVKVLINGGADIRAQNEVNYKYHNTEVNLCALVT